jgi:NADH-quinone oxidoreductase subunit B
MSNSSIKIVEPPEGVVEDFSPQPKWCCRYGSRHFWPLPASFMVWSFHYDLFGSERYFLRQADMLMVMGTISKNGYLTSGIRANVRTKMGYCWRLCFLRRYFHLSRNWQSYSWRVTLGCPPRPEQIVDGVMKLQELVRTKTTKKFTWIPGIIGIL